MRPTGDKPMGQDHALITDLYQLTMAQAYWHSGKQDTEASFYLHFRENPFKGGYTVACGITQAAEHIERFSFTNEDLAYLSSVKASNGDLLFDPLFLTELANLTLTLDIDAVREGEVVFPREPILRVTGSILQCQIVETALLNCIGFESVVATKAARICSVAQGPVAEFGLRRAQGPAGGLFASYAAIVGGCSSTSNVAAGKRFDLPVSGTHAHSWVMAFDSELEAFRAYAITFPHNCTLLVDTYDTLKGVANAIIVGHEMEQRGEQLAAIRIDSGDLAWLSKQARALLDGAGLAYVKIIASNDLDEHTILSLTTEQGARIDAWGVGTRLATAFDQPALGCVYKMSAVRSSHDEAWKPCLKISEQIKKSSLPGTLAVRRYLDENNIMVGDMIYDLLIPPTEDRIIDPTDDLRQKDLSAAVPHELLAPLIRKGKAVRSMPSALEAQETVRTSLAQLDTSNKRLLNSHSYPVGLERSLLALRDRLVREARGLV
ncbi:MAG: nicotinate phosphoribosyltransferase [Coriobacteriia bacterium]|nr:nicotinate phosphoribosyltransferase [Coriobacteriia bacterium]